MRKLTNISPFLLLLVPVFVMMILTFGAASNSDTQNEVAMKTTSSTSAVKVVKALIK